MKSIKEDEGDLWSKIKGKLWGKDKNPSVEESLYKSKACKSYSRDKVVFNRQYVHKLVGLFYQPTYKTFYINSMDGENICVPIGVFVSLGMTTSWETLNRIKDFLNNKDIESSLVEISSRNVNGTFINTIIETDPVQYKISVEDYPSGILDRSQVIEELKNLRSKTNLNMSLEELTSKEAQKVNKLQNYFNQIENDSSNLGWDFYKIQKLEDIDDYKIYHSLINYKKVGDLEYRIGVYVRERTEDD